MYVGEQTTIVERAQVDGFFFYFFFFGGTELTPFKIDIYDTTDEKRYEFEFRFDDNIQERIAITLKVQVNDFVLLDEKNGTNTRE